MIDADAFVVEPIAPRRHQIGPGVGGVRDGAHVIAGDAVQFTRDVKKLCGKILVQEQDAHRFAFLYRRLKSLWRNVAGNWRCVSMRGFEGLFSSRDAC